MERTEPSLVPEWLKGGGGGGGGHHALHQDDGSFRQQRSQLFGSNSDNESPRYAPPRRLGSPAGAFSSERPLFDKNGFPASRVYPNFSNNRSYRNNYDSGDRADWDLDRERDRLGGYLNDGKDESRWGSSGSGRFEQEFSGRRFNAVGNSCRENGERKNENGVASGITGQKAVFERNFPSLTAQPEKPYSSLGNVTVLSPRHHWQHPSRPSGDSSNSPTWTSNLADLASNGVAPPPPAPPLNGPKMAEALVQSSPRLRTPALAAEAQRLALKQSRQLVPMIPKTTTPNSKPKPKMLSSPKGSPLLIPGYRPQGGSRPETGKLHVLSKQDSGVGVAPATGGRPLLSANLAPRKQKQLLDRRALPIPPLSANAGGQDGTPNVIRPKENGTTEDKRLAQNRSDFFNTLRKKAASGASNSSEKSDSIVEDKHESSPVVDNDSESSKLEHQGGTRMVESGGSGDNEDINKDKLLNSNGVTNGCYEASGEYPALEEEEAAFMRSLGWREDDAETGLTDEEIAAFYQQLSSTRQLKLQKAVVMRVGTASPGLSSSDSELV